MMVGVPRVARRRPRQIEARAADREFMRRQLAEHDGAGAAQPCHADRVLGGDIVDQDLRMAGRRQAGDIDDVLDADRHAVQRAAPPSRRDLGFGGLGGRHRRLGIEPDEGMQPRVEPADPVEQRRHQLDRRQLAGGDRRCRRCRRHPVQFAHSPSPPRIGGQGSARGSARRLDPRRRARRLLGGGGHIVGKLRQRLVQPGAPRQEFDRRLVHAAPPGDGLDESLSHEGNCAQREAVVLP